MEMQELYAGARYTAYAVVDDRGNCPVHALVGGCPQQDQRSFQLRTRTLCDVGPEDMRDCDYVAGKVWKLKVSHHLRVYLFRDGAKLILTNGEWKTKRRDDPRSLERAILVRQLFDGRRRQ